MCGINGIINVNKNKVDMGLLNKMNNVIRHRGPEHEGFYVSGNIGFAHRRLKIIDLSDNGNQPMCNETGDIFITYNGQIYNYLELRQELISKGHKFKSQSDTEIILHAYEEWGYDCLEYFIGMWAFAIWDDRKKSLFIARDRLGIKPVYYFYNGESFIFASEIKALLENTDIDRKADIRAIYEYLYLGYSLGDKTWIKEIYKLKPAHFLILKGRDLTIRRYWEAQIAPDYSITENKAVEELRCLLDNSVRIMLRSDVEIGSHLSGGIDSSTVTILANKLLTKRLKTFSGIFSEGEEFDESFYINQVAGQYGISNERLIIKSEDFIENIKKIIWHMDEPTAGPGAYPLFFVSKLINSNGIKVVLSGEGGDELFAGYPYYYSGILESICRYYKLNLRELNKFPFKIRNFSSKIILPYLRRFISRAIHLKRYRVNRFLNRETFKCINFIEFEENMGFYKGSLENMQYWDISNYLPALLQVEDRLGMAFSVEARLPFLNHHIVEYALRIPFYLKINNLNFKYILRQAMKAELPKSIYERVDKKGFPTPTKIWFRDNELCQAISCEVGNVLSSIFVNKVISWERLNIGLWLKIFKINL